MPTYSYACDACKGEFEREQRISEKPIRKCPFCGRKKARRLITNGNFILKGGGWYADGYGVRSGATASSPKNGGSSSSKPSSSTDSAGSTSSTEKGGKTETTKASSESAAVTA